jgi:hypothetical protein
MCLSVDTASPFFSRRRETAISLPEGALPSAAMHGAVYHRGIHARERSTGPHDPEDSCCSRRISYAVKYLDFWPPQISAALQVMRTQRGSGFNLHRLRGQGAYGVAVEVNHQDRRFTGKLDTCAYSSQSSKHNVLVEAALLSFCERIQNGAQNSGAAAIGPFAQRLRQWDGCPAVLINREGQRFAAVAMEQDWSWRTLARAKSLMGWMEGRFRAENCDNSRENQCLLRDLRRLLTGCLKVVDNMHRAGLAHCDCKPDKMLNHG